jgi:5-formyltetrahydrofolate cyclo-ligase
MATAMIAIKTTVRRQLKKQITAMTDEKRQQESLEVIRKLLNHEWYEQSQKVSVYLSMENEVDTTPLVKDILESGRLCFIPRYKGDQMDMLQLYSLDDLSKLPQTKWNIKQPSGLIISEQC